MVLEKAKRAARRLAHGPLVERKENYFAFFIWTACLDVGVESEIVFCTVS